MASRPKNCDDELQPLLDNMTPTRITNEDELAAFRSKATQPQLIIDEYHTLYPLSKLKHSELTVGTEGHSIALSMFSLLEDIPDDGRWCIFYIHGGGFIFGDRFSGLSALYPLIHQLKAICITVGYRLAPEHPAPAALNDCWAALREIWHRRETLHINDDKLIVVGRSAGAALAAGVTRRALECDDRDKPQIRAQLMSFPMLDDRSNTESCEKYKNLAPWQRDSNKFAWEKYLGDTTRSIDIIPGRAPAEKLQGYPPTRIDLAMKDILYDEGLEFGKRLEQAGCQVTVREWDGYHCFDGGLGKDTKVGRELRWSQLEWLKEIAM
ncbi:hypothetical protein EYB25_005027 [Talaromyces marneffei]|uniref:Lipase/esterase, putative n=1 Tax=Talaromyces marneffei (strain ATCC 18224 / CBS 334.59 / QM 7333) TaxID=441960 RepID=B6QDP7_TALMQ|nr:lipase/esterase, putative [Talaromyces marneffei ATCC 18224]KAE8553645.1 hypothetical protein EYB25_005027 [Talaromyces marneffei]